MRDIRLDVSSETEVRPGVQRQGTRRGKFNGGPCVGFPGNSPLYTHGGTAGRGRVADDLYEPVSLSFGTASTAQRGLGPNRRSAFNQDFYVFCKIICL
jgi:hypothetical protein